MLRIEPVSGIGGAHKFEITALAKAPHHIARASAVKKIDFDDPILVAHREQQIVIVARIQHSVRVRPVRKDHRAPVNVEVIERIPRPIGIEVLVHVHQSVANHAGCPRGSR